MRKNKVLEESPGCARCRSPWNSSRTTVDCTLRVVSLAPAKEVCGVPPKPKYRKVHLFCHIRKSDFFDHFSCVKSKKSVPNQLPRGFFLHLNLGHIFPPPADSAHGRGRQWANCGPGRLSLANESAETQITMKSPNKFYQIGIENKQCQIQTNIPNNDFFPAKKYRLANLNRTSQWCRGLSHHHPPQCALPRSTGKDETAVAPVGCDDTTWGVTLSIWEANIAQLYESQKLKHVRTCRNYGVKPQRPTNLLA